MSEAEQSPPTRPSFFAELKRRKVVRVAITYAVVAWLIIQIAATTFEGFGIPEWAFRFVTLMVILGFPVALIITWAFELTPDGIKLTKNVSAEEKAETSQSKRNWLSLGFAAGLPTLIFGALALYFFITRSGESIEDSDKSIAVLAFANLSEDSSNEYFSDGISEELLNVLAKIPGLKVTARTSAFHFKGRDIPIPEIAEQLGVAYVVEGSVRKSGDTVRITAQLIKADGGFHLWSDSFTRELKDIFALQDEIAGLIAEQLQLELGFSTGAEKVVDPEAYRLVLEGNHFWIQRTFAALDRAERAFQTALEIAPDFAEAHAGLARVWLVRDWWLVLEGQATPENNFERAKAAAHQALSLDPNMAEAYLVMGAVHLNQWNYGDSQIAFEKALHLNPNVSLGRHWYVNLLMVQGKLEEALEEANRTVDLNPLSFVTLSFGTRTHFLAADYERALSLNERAMAIGPKVFPPLEANRAAVLFRLGKEKEAVAWARSMGADLSLQPRWGADWAAIHVLYKAGFEEEARNYANRARELVKDSGYNLCLLALAIGEEDKALDLMLGNKTIQDATLDFFFNEAWDPVRDDPRFIQAMERYGVLSEYEKARESLARVIHSRKEGIGK